MAASTLASLHVKARTPEYLGGIKRAVVPDDKVPWSVPWNEYNPVDYTASVVLKGPAWADPDIRSAITDILKFTIPLQAVLERNYQIQRNGRKNKPCEFYGKIRIGKRDTKVPKRKITTHITKNFHIRNPAGRTGMCGRGLLGKWGPNHAADPIVTR